MTPIFKANNSNQLRLEIVKWLRQRARMSARDAMLAKHKGVVQKRLDYAGAYEHAANEIDKAALAIGNDLIIS